MYPCEQVSVKFETNHENAFENVVWRMVAILSRPQYVKAARITLIQMPGIAWLHFDIHIGDHTYNQSDFGSRWLRVFQRPT